MNNRLLINSVVWAMAGLFLGISAGIAAEFPYPKVEFSADMMMKIKTPGSGQDYAIKGKVYSSKNKERREISTGGRTVAVLKDKNKDETVTLMPAQKMYMKNQGAQTHKDPEKMIKDGELKMTQQGSERVNGKTATKYKIESTQQGKESFTGYAWFTRENIPIRFEGTSSEGGTRQDVEIDYTNIVIGKQNPKLFSIPSDYRMLPTGMGKGLTPEQMKQFKKMMEKQRKP